MFRLAPTFKLHGMSSPLAFLAGDTVSARLMRAHDWSDSPLGPPDQWPQSLRSVVNLMLGSAFPMFVAWGPTLCTLYNDAYAAIMGDKHPAGLGKPFLEIWREIEGDLLPLTQRVSAGEAFYMENLPLRMDRRGYDEDTWFTFSWSPVLDDAGRIGGIYCACTETTAMVLAERHQRAEQERLQALFNQAPGFIAVMRGQSHVFELANQAYLQLTGFREVIGKTVAEALPEVVGQGFLALLDQVFATGEPYVGRSAQIMLNRERDAAPSEAYVDFVFQPLRGPGGEVDGIFVQGHEVTDLQRAQQALLVFSNSIPAMAWVAATDGAIERVNSQWSLYTGLAAEAALGHGWANALHPEDRAAALAPFQAARLSGAEWQAEYRLRQHNGAYRWFLARAVSQRDVGGRVLRWFGTATDIDDARKNAHALLEADRQKDEFLATLAHELRNPLAPIRTAVHLLGLPLADDAARVRATRVIERQVGHMSRLLDDLIDIARITQRRLALKKETVRVESIVENAVEAARPRADAKRHVLSVNLPDAQAQVFADPVRLAQVLANLLNNAAKYTDPGGHITLDVRSDGGWLTFVVTDTGIGLSREALDKVFVMFAQEQSALERSEGGLGIGLALAKGLTELHGGTVTAHSEGMGRGSRFVVRLPEEEASLALPVLDESGPAAQALRPLTVLLADDNRDAVDVLAELVGLEGHAVHVAYDGSDAARLARQLQPDVLVLDIGMPGLNGYEVARHVRAQDWGARALLIAATGWGQEDDRNKAFASGFDRHMTKPFDPAALLAVMAGQVENLRVNP